MMIYAVANVCLCVRVFMVIVLQEENLNSNTSYVCVGDRFWVF